MVPNRDYLKKPVQKKMGDIFAIIQQVNMKNIVKCVLDFFANFNALETNSGLILSDLR